MFPRFLLPRLLMAAVGCSSEGTASKCGPNTGPLPEGSSVPVTVRDSDAGVAPVFVDTGLYGPTDEFAIPPASPRPSRSGTVTKTHGQLMLTVDDGQVIPLTRYFCD